jgi:ferredoxin-nitrite reductase
VNNPSPEYLDGFLAAIGGAPANGSGETAARSQGNRSDGSETGAATSSSDDSLSREEQIKSRLHPLDAFPRLLECVHENRAPTADDQFRFQWHGLFYQAPESDAFLFRLRLPGGKLKSPQLDGLADLVQEHGGGFVRLNAQGSLDLPGVPVRAAEAVLAGMEAIGLSTRQTGGDCVQAVRGGETEALDETEPAPTILPLVLEMEETLASRRDLANLPGGCEIEFLDVRETLALRQEGRDQTIVVYAMPTLPQKTSDFTVRPEENICLLVPPGCDDRGIVLPAGQIIPACVRLLETWSTNGDRTNRSRARLKEFCAGVGLEALISLVTQGESQNQDHFRAAAAARAGGGNPAGVAVPGAQLLSRQLARLAEMMRAQNLDEVRLAAGHLFVANMRAPAIRRSLEAALRSG